MILINLTKGCLSNPCFVQIYSFTNLNASKIVLQHIIGSGSKLIFPSVLINIELFDPGKNNFLTSQNIAEF